MELQFTIADQTYKVPQYISVECFARAIVWNLDDLNNLKPFVATIMDAPLSAVHQLDPEVLAFITGVCLQRFQLGNQEMKHHCLGHNLIDFDDMTFSQFVDLDTFISKGIANNIIEIGAILYDAPRNTIKRAPIEDIWGAVLAVSKWREQCYKEYDEFFELEENREGPQPPSEGAEANIQLMWWEAIMALANEDFLKIHQVVERPWREALNYLTWKKAQVQKQKLQNLKAKNDLSRRTK
jgi:hypothetical protein